MAETLPSPKDAIEQLLTSMTQFEASDLHLKVGYAPYYRIAGKLRKTHMAPLPDRKFVEDMMAGMVPEVRREEYEAAGAIDFSAKGHTGDRYRINMFRASGDVHVSIRRVQSKIPSFESLHLPQVYEDAITKNMDGLVLVSGVTARIGAAVRKPETADPWLVAMLARKPRKLVAVALANKTARIAWVIMARGESYRKPQPATQIAA